MSCTIIKVYKLSQQASNVLGGVTEAVLDLGSDAPIRLSKNVEQLSIINQITTEGATGFSLPFTRTNDAVFSEYKSPVTVDNDVNFYTVSVSVAGHEIMFNRLLVKGRSIKTKTWEVELRRSPDHWAELASQVKTNELDFGTFVMGLSQLTTHWPFEVYDGDFTTPNVGQRPYYWPLVDYGGWCDQTEPIQGNETSYNKSVGVEDFRPWLSFVYILRAGLCAIGWTLDGVILTTDWFKRLWVYDLRPDYYIASKQGGRFIGRRFVPAPWVNSSSQYLYVDEISQGIPAWYVTASGGTLAGIKNISGIALKYRFQMQGDFTNNRALFFNAIFGIFETDGGSPQDFTGEIVSTDNLLVEFAAFETKNVVLDMEVTLQPGQSAAIHIGQTPNGPGQFLIEKGLYVKITPVSQSLMIDDNVIVAECVSDEHSILYWIKGAVQLCQGRIETDWETKTLTIHPNNKADVFGETVPAFLLDEEAATDINELIIVDSIESKPLRSELKRFTRLQFAPTTDAYISSLNLIEPPHSRKLTNGLDLPNDVEEIENPAFEPTLEGQPIGIASGSGNRQPLPYLPRLWDNTDGNRSFNIGPRILYAFGPVRQINPQPITIPLNQLTSFFLNTPPNPSNTGLITDFGYATMLPTWELTPTPAVNGNIVFGTEKFDLFVNFWLNITQDFKSGEILDLLLSMKMKDYVSYNFRKMYTFRYNGIPLRVPMTDIRDFNACSDTPTPVQFFVQPVETECCDLPCGCQFTTCDYYQDFGTFMTQATLDLLKITSFMVDGIEYVTSPVSFGTISIISVGSDTYVMNMIDALNSIGAPYFNFGMSTRQHPEKGLRFFTIKRPSCIEFSIMIEEVGVTEVYNYTDQIQQTKWFTGSWADFGYSSAFYGNPIGCETTTEY